MTLCPPLKPRFPMTRVGVAALLLFTATTATTASAATPTMEAKLPVPVDPSVFAGMLKGYKDCRAKYAEMDARIDAAGVRDGGYYRVPGFPYFRTDRFAASYKDEVKGLDDTAGWMRRMREFDQEAREFEYRNLGMSDLEIGSWRYDLLACGGGLANLEMYEEANLAYLRRQVVIASEYAAKAPPLNAVQKQALKARRDATLARFQMPLDAATGATLWTAKPVEDLKLIAQGYGNAIPDELGVPALIDSQWRAFAEKHAPALWIEGSGELNHPGMPAVLGEGYGVDAARPRMQYQITFTRRGEVPLTQINYFIWMPADPATGHSIDSLIWRVTLDTRAEPLVYEWVTASGLDYLMFPAQKLKARSGNKTDADAPLLPQVEVVSGPVALRITAGSHQLRRVVPLASATAGAGAEGSASLYALGRYEEVFTLPAGDGGRTRSLYDLDGRIPGQTDRDLAMLWGPRLTGAGALRALGRIPVSPTGQAHFDDADRLERMFGKQPVEPKSVGSR